MKLIELNNDLPKIKTGVKEVMDINVPDVNDNIPHRRGFVYMMVGSGGSGKSSLLLSMFKSKDYYRGKFDNIYYFIPEASYLSVVKHPFNKHDHVYHSLTIDKLDDIYQELNQIKEDCIDNGDPIETSLIIIDDMANIYKGDIELAAFINKMVIKSRHLSVCWIFTLQSYNLMPLTIRKQITNITIFKPKNNVEWELLKKEILNLSKDDSKTVYDYIFDIPYNHLDIDTVENRLYKNFNEILIEE